ncbi:Siderophore synthetase component [Thalassobacillus cyri]|uniref:Siderophore synthetase component n=1 Tax=Thalassobacillus cyri TaxID=571932 RepID=A0A1H3W6Q7_9BACI|nr:IucA/IucC family protein [Thalassobacillus cyri]SDZ82746.1 Siderophore synthetase component [Thalassobacillus cyri]
MKNVQVVAENATMQSFLNCYLKETGNFHIESANGTVKKITCPLSNQGIDLTIDVKYWSETGRHLFEFPLYYQTGKETKPIDYVTLAALITKELALMHNQVDAEDELILRVILSCKNLKKYLEHRLRDSNHLSSNEFNYIEAEQSLIFGHLLHPTPKSKQGITEEEDNRFSPEMNGKFQLHYFLATDTQVVQDSSLSVSAQDIIQGELPKEELVTDEAGALIPAHPLQARALLKKASVQQMLKENKLKYLGPLGSEFTATSSFRTVYSPESKYMYKFSVPIKITNSLRMNQQKELDRGVEVSRLLQTALGDDLKRNFPDFHVISDPAYIRVDIPGEEEVSLDCIIRENPFYGNDSDAILAAGLGQDHPFGEQSRLYSIIHRIAEKENRSLQAASEDWFKRYLSITLDPVLWLYETYGIALEAHQQNSIVQLKDGYPDSFYYRDNQGYYFREKKADELRQLLPTLNEKSDTICTEAIAEERLRYYFFFNHLFGVINGFGANGLIAEEDLLRVLRERLETHHKQAGDAKPLLHSLLTNEKLPSKANLLTRFHDMDELIGSLETQSVYTMAANPLVQKAGVTSET